MFAGAFYTFSPQIFVHTPWCCGDNGTSAGHIVVSLIVGEFALLFSGLVPSLSHFVCAIQTTRRPEQFTSTTTHWLLLALACHHTHTHIHTLTHTHNHALTHTHTHSHTHSHTHNHALTHINSHSFTHTHIHTHSHTSHILPPPHYKCQSGVLGGLLSLFVFRIGLFLIGMCFGLLLALGLHLTPIRDESWLDNQAEVIAFYTGLMLVGGIASLFLRKVFVILTTSIGGSLLFLLGIEYFARTGFGALLLYSLSKIVDAIRGDLAHGSAKVTFHRSFSTSGWFHFIVTLLFISLPSSSPAHLTFSYCCIEST